MLSNQQNSGVPTKKEAKRIEFENLPFLTTFVFWKMKSEVAPAQVFPTEAMVWINELESVRNIDELKSSDFHV